MTKDYLMAIHGSEGAKSRKDAKLKNAKRNLQRGLQSSISFYSGILVNDIPRDLVIVHTKTDEVCHIEAMPTDSLNVGDSIYFEDKHWLVTSVSRQPTQTYGEMQLCNHLFKWQSFNTDVIQRYGVYQNGTLKTADNKVIVTPDDNYTVLLPLDSETEKIFRGKRLCGGVVYNDDGQKILDVYKVTGLNNKNGLQQLTVASDQFAPDLDNFNLQICNYVAPNSTPSAPEPPSEELLNCVISGRNTLRVGSTRTYTATFYQSDNETATENVTAVWSITPTTLSVTSSGNTAKLIVDNDTFIGQKIELSVVDSEGAYNQAVIEIEVIA